MQERQKSVHILNTSATLFGLCFVVLTSLKALKLDKDTLIDEFTTCSMFLFMISCLLSFLSIRSNTRRALVYEQIADYVFLGGLCTLLIITIFIGFHVV